MVIEKPVVVAGPRGFLKLHLKSAHLKHHAGPPLERMSPYVIIKIGDFLWESPIKDRGGHQIHWEFAHMDFEVRDPMAMMRIEVHDRSGMFSEEPIGHCETRVDFFCRPGGCEEWLELRFRGMDAGRIHFISEFRPQEEVVVVEQPRIEPVPVPVPVPAPVVIAEAPRPMMDAGMRVGHLKLHLKAAHLKHHAGPPLERMSPFVIIRVGEFEWRSPVKEQGGHQLHWDFAHMDMEVFDQFKPMRIEVLDHAGLFNNEPIGHCEVPTNFFCRVGGCEEWLELKFRGMNAGRIHFRSEYMPN